MFELTIITLLSFLSATVTSVFGFGAGLVLTPLLTFIMPIKQALGIGALVFFFTSLSKTYWYFPDINWNIWKKCLPLSLVGIALGMFIVQYAPHDLLEIVFAIILAFYSLNALLGRKEAPSHLPMSCYPLFAGIASILVHAAGVFYFRYCRLNHLDRVQTVATIALLHFTLNIFKAIFFTTGGLIDPHYLYRLIPAYAAAVFGTRLGKTLLKRYVNERLFTVGVSSLLMLLAVKFFFSAL